MNKKYSNTEKGFQIEIPFLFQQTMKRNNLFFRKNKNHWKMFSLIVCLILFSSKAFALFEFNKNISEAYLFATRLQFLKSDTYLITEKKLKPENALIIFTEDYSAFLKIFISEEQASYDDYRKKFDKNFSIIDKQNDNSPWYNYVKAEMLIHLALLEVKFNDKTAAAFNLRKAYKIASKNQSVFPSFELNKKQMGFLHSAVGAVPADYSWLINAAGMEGSIERGNDELNSCLILIASSSLKVFSEEILFSLSNIHNSFIKNNDKANVLEKQIQPYISFSPLMQYCMITLLMKQGKNDDAIEIANKFSFDESYATLHFLNYKKGLLFLQKLDLSAEKYFRSFLLNFKGKNFVKATYQKLAWLNFLKGDEAQYFSNMALCKKIGNNLIDDDDSALKEAESNMLPNKNLLRARLLFDGGYYDDALKQIYAKPITEFPLYRDQLELSYRMARIYYMKKDLEKSAALFRLTLKNGTSSSMYFAANSALSLGQMSEERGNFTEAKKYFEQTLKIRHHDYQNSIDQKAKAGLDRINKKLIEAK